MALRIKQPQCGGCVPCYPGYGPDPCATTITIGTAACASRAGSGSLFGHCKFVDPTTGDLNQRRYRVRSLGGQWCSTNCAPTARAQRDFDVVYTVDDSGACSVSGSNQGGGSCYPSATCYTDPSTALPLCGQGQNILFTPCTAYSETATTRLCTSIGAGFVVDRDYYDILSAPDTVDAALQRAGGGTTGTSCRTAYTTDSNGTCTDGYSGSTTFTATSVIVSVPLSNMVPGCTYVLTVEVDRYTHAGSFVDSITDSVSFTAGAASDTLEYYLPIRSDYAYEFTGIHQ